MGGCWVEGCAEPVYSRKKVLCQRHWHADRAGHPLVPLNLAQCADEGCERPVEVGIHGLCRKHYDKRRLKGGLRIQKQGRPAPRRKDH